MGSRRDIQSHHLLDRFDPDEAVRDGRQVIEPVPVGRYHWVLPVLRYLLHPAMQVPYVAVEIDHGLAVEPEDDAKHSVRRGVLRPHVQDHLWAVQKRLSSCRYLYLVHNSKYRIQNPGVRSQKGIRLKPFFLF